MNTAANLLVILLFLAAFYSLLGLLCGIVEKARELTARPQQRRPLRRETKCRTRRRGLTNTSGRVRAPKPRGAALRGDVAAQ